MRFAIIGCGRIGEKRAASLSDGHTLVVAVDPVRLRAENVASRLPGAVASTDWRAAVDHQDVEAVIIATTNDALAATTLAAVDAGKHVLVEKPAARSVEELLPVMEGAERAGVCVQVGFNHRFHPAFRRAREIVDSGLLGPLMFIRGRYGHGGRPGYDREWRADPRIAGGGELVDQGTHLIDLSRWFLGDFATVDGFAHTYYWDMPVEDNGFMLLRTAQQQVAFLHASCTEWKNLFSFEIYGRVGKLQIEGLGGSYGTERLYFYAMRPEMGPPDTTIQEYPGEDRSWRTEMDAFVRSIERSEAPSPGLPDALAALRIVAEVYDRSARE